MRLHCITPAGTNRTASHGIASRIACTIHLVPHRRINRITHRITPDQLRAVGIYVAEVGWIFPEVGWIFPDMNSRR
jgi:hypothetical protein